LQAFFGALTVWLTYRIATKLNSSSTVDSSTRVAPTLAAVLVALDPILLRQSTAAMTEPFAAMLATVGVLCLVRLGDAPSWKRGLLAGLILGLAALCRPTFVIWAGLVVIWLGVLGVRQKKFRAITCSVALGVAAMLTPWTARNYVVMGHPIFATTHGGYTLWLGNNHLFYAHLRSRGPAELWDSKDLDARFAQMGADLEYDERRVDRECYRLAKATIADDPRGFALSSVVRAGRLFQPIPNQVSGNEGNMNRAIRYGIGVWYFLVGGGLVIGLWSVRRDLRSTRHMPTLLLVFAFVGLHTFYWSNMRMRAPLMPALSVLVAIGWPKLRLFVIRHWLDRRSTRM
jgi:4-amino-4-deoxy-L-arabinose transferase-like glycosyltransferase